MFAECVSSFVRLTSLIVLPECLRGDLWFLFCHESSACHLFQVLADALRVNKTLTELYLSGNHIGDEGVKVWWVERCGASPGDLSSINGSDGNSPDLIGVCMVEP